MPSRIPLARAATTTDATLDPADVSEVLAAILPGLAAQRMADAATPLAALFRKSQLRPRAPLLRQGEVWGQAFLIQEGLIRMVFVDREGNEYNKNFFDEGRLICPIAPAMWLQPSLFGIHAIEPTRVWVADAGMLRQVLVEHGLWRDLQCELLARLLTGKLQREHDLLALDGWQRYQAFQLRHPGLIGRLPLKHLASFLGLTDVSLSRLRRAHQVRKL